MPGHAHDQFASVSYRRVGARLLTRQGVGRVVLCGVRAPAGERPAFITIHDYPAKTMTGFAAFRSALPMRVRPRRGIGVLFVAGQEVVVRSGYRVTHG